jgi:hypothetical protein
MSVHLSACPSVRPPARMEQLGQNWVDFHEIRYVSDFGKSVRGNSDMIRILTIRDALHEDLCTYFLSHPAQFLS